MVPLPLGKTKGLLLRENLNILCTLKSASQFILTDQKKKFSREDVAIIYSYIVALYYRTK